MRLALVSLLLFLVGLPAPSLAKEVKFRVRVLLATKQGNRIDPQIGPNLKTYLKKSFGVRYTSFRLLDNRVLRVKLGKTGEVSLPDQSVLKLKYRELQGDFVKLTMEMRDLRTTIRIRDGGLFFQAGHRYRNGMLILAISARTMKKGKKGGEEEIAAPVRPEPRPGKGEGRKADRPIEKK